VEVEFISKYKKNTGLIMSPTELRDLYFYGVDIKSKDGSTIPVYIWESQIKSAQQEIEKFLGIKFQRQMITETLHYFRDDYMNSLPILNTSFPVYKPLTLIGRINNTEQVKYPSEWLSSYVASDEAMTRRISLIPTGSSTAATNVLLIGVMAQLGIRSLEMVPNYWTVQYLTGWAPKRLPMELLDVTGKWAAIKMFHVAGDLILGAGIASLSLGIDGLSQSISSTSSATNAGYGSRIIGYLKDVDNTLKRIVGVYKGINFTIC
jgi:hypothetical protein